MKETTKIFKEPIMEATKPQQRVEQAIVEVSLTSEICNYADRLTDRARRVYQLANQEAQRFGFGEVGTEHILLGLRKEGSGVASTALNESFGISLKAMRDACFQVFGEGPNTIVIGKLPTKPECKLFLEMAAKEADAMKHTYIGTEHLLLAFTSGVKFQGCLILESLKVSRHELRKEVFEMLGQVEPISQQELAEAAEEAKGVIAETAERHKEDKSELHQLSEGITKLIGGWVGDITSREYLYKHLDEMLANAFASRDEELRRLREENERLRKENGELRHEQQKREGMPEPDVAYLNGAKNMASRLRRHIESGECVKMIANADADWITGYVNELRSQLTTLERHYSEARGLVEKGVSGLKSIEAMFCPLAVIRYDANEGVVSKQFAEAHHMNIVMTLHRHDQERAACKPCGESLTHSEAEKICAGEPVRTTKDFGAVVAAKLESDPQLKASVECEGEVMLLQSENEKLKEQRDLAYNWLSRKDKEMFDQKYPKEVTV